MYKKNSFKKDSTKGILFWITGLSGSGKTTLGKNIFNFVKKNFGPTLIFSGDEIRKIFNLNLYDLKSRIEYLNFYINLCKNITDQNINVIFCVVGLNDNIRKINRAKFKNYIEIFLKTRITDIKKLNKKKIYRITNKNLWGIDLKPDFPKYPDIIIKNDFSKSPKDLSLILMKKLFKYKNFFSR
jgi:adenylylsulfate kinase